MAGHGKGHHHDDHSDWVVTNKMIVQDVLNACPQALAVFEKHLQAWPTRTMWRRHAGG